jgi:hypothetical protein
MAGLVWTGFPTINVSKGFQGKRREGVDGTDLRMVKFERPIGLQYRGSVQERFGE